MKRQVGPTIIYIAAASRSGSTLLEEELSARLWAENLGEFRRLGDFYHKDQRQFIDPKLPTGCSCGEAIGACPFWSSTADDAGVDLAQVDVSSGLGPVGRLIFRVLCHTIRPAGVRLLARVIPALRRELAIAKTCFALFDAVGAVTGTKVLIDASKQVHHFLLLRAYAPERIKFLALTRDGRAVAKSMVRGERGDMMRVRVKRRSGKELTSSKALLKSGIAAWRLTILQMALVRLFLSKRLRYDLRYEDFCEAPDRHVARIAARFGVPERPEGAPRSRHTIGGSPSRSRADLQTIRRDDRWIDEWTSQDEVCFGPLDRAVNRWLGYRSPSRTDL